MDNMETQEKRMENAEYQREKARIITNYQFLVFASLLNVVVLVLSFIFDSIWWRLVSFLFFFLIIKCLLVNNHSLKSLNDKANQNRPNK